MRELALVTVQMAIKNQSAREKMFKPKCMNPAITDWMSCAEQIASIGHEAYECFNVSQSVKLVKESYVLVNIDFTDFVETQYAQDETVGLTMVVDTVGGNLGK